MKRPREGLAYDASVLERAQKTKEFITSLKFSKPIAELRKVTDRAPCPQCGKRRLYYCYDCLKVTHPSSHPDPVHLPLQVHVVLHPGEHRSKSTSLAASTISPDLHISTYPSVPENLDPDTTLVLYPSAHSTTLDKVENLHQYKQVLFVDSTWQQSKGVARDERVTKFKHVRIAEQTSLFWRFQNNDPTYLATVEAIYYFLREYITQVNKQAKRPEPHYTGEVDDILYYYLNQYILIQQSYARQEAADSTSQHKQFTTRHFDGYVLEGVSWDDVLNSSATTLPTNCTPSE